MNKREAIEQTITLWARVQAHSNLDPHKAKAKAANECGMMHYIYQCPLCQYTSQLTKDGEQDCRECPIWPGDHEASTGCNNPGQPYCEFLSERDNGEKMERAAREALWLLA